MKKNIPNECGTTKKKALSKAEKKFFGSGKKIFGRVFFSVLGSIPTLDPQTKFGFQKSPKHTKMRFEVKTR